MLIALSLYHRELMLLSLLLVGRLRQNLRWENSLLLPSAASSS